VVISLDIIFVSTRLFLKFMKIIEIQKGKNKKINTLSTQMNTRCIMGNLVWEKTHIEGEAFDFLSFIQL